MIQKHATFAASIDSIWNWRSSVSNKKGRLVLTYEYANLLMSIFTERIHWFNLTANCWKSQRRAQPWLEAARSTNAGGITPEPVVFLLHLRPPAAQRNSLLRGSSLTMQTLTRFKRTRSLRGEERALENRLILRSQKLRAAAAHHH